MGASAPMPGPWTWSWMRASPPPSEPAKRMGYQPAAGAVKLPLAAVGQSHEATRWKAAVADGATSTKP